MANNYPPGGGGGGSSIAPFVTETIDDQAAFQVEMAGPDGDQSFSNVGFPETLLTTVNVETTTDQYPAGETSSARFGPYPPGSSVPYYLTPTSNALTAHPDTNDFTFEVWANLLTNPAYGDPDFYTCFFDTRLSGAASGLIFALNSNRKMVLGIFPAGNVKTSANAVSLNAWHHLVWQRNSGTLRFFIDGVLDANAPSAPGNFQGSGCTVGMSVERVSNYPRTDGYLSNLRFTVGRAVYPTTNFTPPALPLPPARWPQDLPSSPAQGQLALSTFDVYAATTGGANAVWRRTPVT